MLMTNHYFIFSCKGNYPFKTHSVQAWVSLGLLCMDLIKEKAAHHLLA